MRAGRGHYPGMDGARGMSYLKWGVEWTFGESLMNCFHEGIMPFLEPQQSRNKGGDIICESSLLLFYLLWVPPTGQTQQKLGSMVAQEMPSLEITEQEREGGEWIWGEGANKG